VLRFSKLIGQDFSDWLDTSSRGSFLQRTEVTRSWAPSDLAASK